MSELFDLTGRRFWVLALVAAVAASAAAIAWISRIQDPRGLWLCTGITAAAISGLLSYSLRHPGSSFAAVAAIVGALGCVVAPCLAAAALGWPLQSTHLFGGTAAGVCLSGVFLSVEALFIRPS